jgi:hypothetical protein
MKIEDEAFMDNYLQPPKKAFDLCLTRMNTRRRMCG